MHLFDLLIQFVEKFAEAKAAARELMKEKQQANQKLVDNEKLQSPGDNSPTSPAAKSPSVISPPASTPGGTIKGTTPLFNNSSPVVSVTPSRLRTEHETGSESEGLVGDKKQKYAHTHRHTHTRTHTYTHTQEGK